MTPDQIAKAVSALPLWDALKVSISTDWIVVLRPWPLWAGISLLALGAWLDLWSNKQDRKRG
jgi:hypothetical protein